MASETVRATHDLTVRLEPAAQFLRATDEVTLPHPGESPLIIRLARQMVIDKITLNGRNVKFSFHNGQVRIPVPEYRHRLHLKIQYGGKFEDPAPAEPLNADNPGYGVTGTISSKGTLLLSRAEWYPAVKGVESVYNITVDLPRGIVAITSGQPLGHTHEKGRTISRWKVAQQLRGIPLAAGAYVVKTRQFGRTIAATYFTAALQHLSDDYLAATGRYLRMYEEMFGPYPFEQFAVVENFFPTGYGFPSFTLMGRRVLQLPFIIHTSLGHEIAHCWWGNGVLVDSSRGNWSEGLTTYVADYLFKERKGEGQSYRIQWLRNYADLVSDADDFPISRFSSRVDPATKVVGYDKTAMVFHMVRQTIGDEAFWAALRDVYAQYCFKAITWSEFQQAFEHRSKIPLSQFFNQWVDRQGAPQLSLSNITQTSNNRGFEIRGTIVQKKPYFNLPLTLALTTDTDEVFQKVGVSGAKTPFSFTIEENPKELRADPDAHLFRRLSPQEVPPTINTIRGASDVAIVVAKDLGADGIQIAGRLAQALGLDTQQIRMAADLNPGDMGGRNTLLVGLPSDPDWLPAGTAQFSLALDAFVLNDQRYARKQNSFFGVFAHPGKASATALFVPADLSLGNALTTKIPHYGKYSYLLFNNTRNKIKGTWEPLRSSMVVRWPMGPKALVGGIR